MSNYPDYPLDESALEATPLPLFQRWLAAAEEANLPEFNAMALATASIDGRPSSRMVLLRGLDERGLAFFTNYESRKADELAVHENAALLFYWAPLHRQIRIEGAVARIAPAESDAYFASRPRGHRLGAWASPQSRTVKDRAELESAIAEHERKFDGGDVERPSYWGGYRLWPVRFEFWQGRLNRLHDRLAYDRAPDGWRISRLAP